MRSKNDWAFTNNCSCFQRRRFPWITPCSVTVSTVSAHIPHLDLFLPIRKIYDQMKWSQYLKIILLITDLVWGNIFIQNWTQLRKSSSSPLIPPAQNPAEMELNSEPQLELRAGVSRWPEVSLSVSRMSNMEDEVIGCLSCESCISSVIADWTPCRLPQSGGEDRDMRGVNGRNGGEWWLSGVLHSVIIPRLGGCRRRDPTVSNVVCGSSLEDDSLLHRKERRRLQSYSVHLTHLHKSFLYYLGFFTNLPFLWECGCTRVASNPEGNRVK